jgi:hypothetical protein
LFAKWNPKNHYFIFFLLAFFLIRVREPAPLSGFLGRGYLASYLAFLPKSRHFCPKTGDFVFSYLHCFFVVEQYYPYTHRPKSADKPACISLGYHHIAFSKINSKCDRAFVAPPEFKSLMLRQSTVQSAFLSTLYRFFMQKTEFLSLTIS